MKDLRWVGHIRGRVIGPVERVGCLHRHRCRTGSHPVYRYQIVNTVTGKVLGGDNAYSLEQALDSAALEVYVARAAWFYGFKKKDLRRKA